MICHDPTKQYKTDYAPQDPGRRSHFFTIEMHTELMKTRDGRTTPRLLQSAAEFMRCRGYDAATALDKARQYWGGRG